MITVKHSGHIGDVIYSLPTVRAIAEARREKVTYYIHRGVPIRTDYDAGRPRPAITDELAEFLKPLIAAQPYIERCETYVADKEVRRAFDYDLDLFRRMPINVYYGHLPLHYMHLCNCFTDYSEPWLTVRDADRIERYKDQIVIGRSTRNINGEIDFGALDSLKRKIYFVGTADEFSTMSKVVSNLEHVRAANAYELACVIASCRLYIGNSSFIFALAEGLKTHRLFEMNVAVQSLMPCGDVRYFITTEQLAAHLSAEFSAGAVTSPSRGR